MNKSKRQVHCAIIFFLVFILYVKTAYRSVAGGDSGELVAQSCRLGVAHPPGYPLFTMINFIATKVLGFMGGSPAFRSNLVSAFLDSLAATISFLSVEMWTAGTKAYEPSAATGSAILFAVSPLIWTYAISSEVFAMNNFFASVLIYLVVRHAKFGRRKDVFLGAFVCGLAMTNQHTIVLFEIPLIISVLLREYRIGNLTQEVLGQSALCFLVGLLPYLYLPISTILLPVDGGGWGDTKSIQGLIRHIRRADYGTFALYSGSRSGQHVEDLLQRFEAYISDLCFRQTLGFFIMPLVMILGVLYGTGCINPRLRKRHKSSPSLSNKKANELYYSIGRTLIVTFSFYVIVFHSLSNLPLSEGLLYGVHARFWQQPNIIIFMFLSCGAGYISSFVSYNFGISPSSHIKSLSITSLFVLMIGIQVSRQIPYLDLSQDNYLVEYGRALLGPLPQDAILVTTYDIQWTVTRYLQECESFRTDVNLLSAPMMSYPWFEYHQDGYKNINFPGTHIRREKAAAADDDEKQKGSMMLSEFVEANLDKKLFVGGHLYHLEDWRYSSDSYEKIPYGLSYLPIPVKNTALMSKYIPNASTYYKDMSRSWNLVTKALPKLAPLQKYNDETWEWMTTRDYWMKLAKASIKMAYLATAESVQHQDALDLAHCARLGEIVLANERLQELSSFKLAHQVLKNTGLCYVRLVKGHFEVPLPEDFNFFAPLNDISPNHQGMYKHFDDEDDSKVYTRTKSLFEQERSKNTSANWKSMGAVRVLELWSKFLSFPEAKSDTSFDTIHKTVHALGGFNMA